MHKRVAARIPIAEGWGLLAACASRYFAILELNAIFAWKRKKHTGILDKSNAHIHVTKFAKVLELHKNEVNSICISNDGLILISAGSDLDVIMWNSDRKSPEYGSKLKVFNIHKSLVWADCISNDNNYFASGSEDASIIIYSFLK